MDGHKGAGASGAAYLLAGVAALVLNAPGIVVRSADPFVIVLAVAHLAWGATLLVVPGWQPRADIRVFIAETLLTLSLLFFLFLYIYALNANIDYVQRFIKGGGDVWLAENTTTERLVAVLRCLPLLGVGVGVFFQPGSHLWGLPATLASSLLMALSMPSFLVLEGVPLLAWFALVPLLLVITAVPLRRAVLYGIAWGAFYSLAATYWLGTYNLVSLQIAMVIQTGYYTLLMVPLVLFYRRASRTRFLVLPMMWTAFEWLRSLGFLGFPWALLGHSQYTSIRLIQMSSIFGVWGVSFVVLLVNAGLAQGVWSWIGSRSRDFMSPAVTVAILVMTTIGGAIFLGRGPVHPRHDVRLALIQQNSDPRRSDYDRTFASLRSLTNGAVQHDPDLIVWSETAFVPNIRRWSQEDPERYRYARLVREFLAYQAGLGRWLLTGNDDYELFQLPSGEQARYEYNAAVLFDPTGNRQQTYRKNRLVPFTEYFPYREQLPAIYDLLIRFDVTLWEPGTERTIFEHPAARFATPICFEDIFPADVRQSVQDGAEIIVNLSNDYWSLTPVEARQHYAASLFRAVENRRPLVRASASGVTAHVDRYGREKGAGPYYEEAYLIADVDVAALTTTFYTRWGDWFPVTCLVLALLILGWETAVATGWYRRQHRPDRID